ncbi:hypothetical protein [Gallaecimonas mangrovi]|uniref:hypothetical protein n=1 Tax=Gallaecimonas mangrovi TaxID=2291597 RepID=UPI000E20328C|nr:hypothetical protein [Gallaecimonas mangrovi]
MSNPFKNIELKYWPDFVLAISGISFVMVLGALIAGVTLPGGTLGWVLLFFGVIAFGVAGKHAHYRRHDKEIHKWVSAWRASFLSNILVLVSLGLIGGAVYVFAQNS